MPRKMKGQLGLRGVIPIPRKPGGGRPKINLHDTNHTIRPQMKKYPAHVTLRMRDFVPNLRTQKFFHLIQECLSCAQVVSTLRVIHFSVQRNHLHMIIETENQGDLESGMKSFTIRFAKRVNKWLRRKGAVFAGRFHLELLTSPTQVKNALRYVLQNAAKHMKRRFYFDIFSSSHFFPNWKELFGFTPQFPKVPKDWFLHPGSIHVPQWWLTKKGWLKAVG